MEKQIYLKPTITCLYMEELMFSHNASGEIPANPQLPDVQGAKENNTWGSIWDEED